MGGGKIYHRIGVCLCRFLLVFGKEIKMQIIMRRMLARKNVMKGFTLVEVIVVLVILAILAAIAIPALTGYIKKAKIETISVTAHEAKTALQTLLVFQYENGGNAVVSAYGPSGEYVAAEDYVWVNIDGSVPGFYKAYPTKVSAADGADTTSLGYKEWTSLTDIPPAFFQHVGGGGTPYWNTAPCGILNPEGQMVGFRIFFWSGDELYAATYGVNLYDTNGSWHEIPDDSGWRYYEIDPATDRVTKL
jgi:prepilin-type N-terminal cleavage/methylation domain-containing protein